MEKTTRRGFLKTAGAAGAAGVAAWVVPVRAAASPAADAAAVLVDTTRCLGCRTCEAACAEAHGLPVPEDELVPGVVRTTGPDRFTVVNAFASTAGDEVRFVKTQCNHCLEPGCAAACPVRALEKTPAGPVVYHAERCIGCRYCMLACPFEVPKYEYDKPAPYVRKCDFCADRQARGLAPACASACPAGALQVGRRADLLEEARRRIYAEPERYLHHIYGEHEAGGLSWLYLSDRPFDAIGLRTDVGERGFAELAQAALAVVPVVMTLWPPFLLALSTFARARDDRSGVARADEEDSHA